jgi:hypothetical protein
MPDSIRVGLDDSPKAQDEAAALAEASAAGGPSVMDKLIEARQERERLNRLEDVKVPGAETLVSKALLLDPHEARVHPANKGFKLRWVNQTRPEKVASRKLEGYVVVPPSEGGKTLGSEYILMRIPVERAEAKKQLLKERGKLWLAAHKNDMERTAAEVAQILQKKFGFGAKEANILVDET